jgi:hypothetical protein
VDNPTKTALATAIIKVAGDTNGTFDRKYERELVVEQAVTFYIPFAAPNNSVIGVLTPPVSVRRTCCSCILLCAVDVNQVR